MLPDKDMDELEYLAELGFGTIPFGDNDLKELKTKVRARSFTHNSSWYFGAICLLLGSFLGLSVFFVFYEVPFENLHLVKSEKKELPVSAAPTPAFDSIRLLEPVVVHDNFVKIQKPQTTIASKSPEPLEEPGVVVIEPIQIQEIPSTGIEENKIRFMANSPVFYIQDLKVTNYPVLYFKRNKFVPTSGLSADFGNRDQNLQPALKTEPQIFLHEELARALLLFKQNRYAEALPIFKNIKTYNNEDINCSFYEAMSFYHLKQYEKAIVLFDECLDSMNNTFLQEAQYYKALALIGNDRGEEGKSLLQRIVTDGEFYSNAAKGKLKEN